MCIKKVKLFKLVVIKEWHPKTTQLVLAEDELEARHLCYTNSKNYDVWLSKTDCVVSEIDTTIVQIIDLNMLPSPCG